MRKILSLVCAVTWPQGTESHVARFAKTMTKISLDTNTYGTWYCTSKDTTIKGKVGRHLIIIASYCVVIVYSIITSSAAAF